MSKDAKTSRGVEFQGCLLTYERESAETARTRRTLFSQKNLCIIRLRDSDPILGFEGVFGYSCMCVTIYCPQKAAALILCVKQFHCGPPSSDTAALRMEEVPSIPALASAHHNLRVFFLNPHISALPPPPPPGRFDHLGPIDRRPRLSGVNFPTRGYSV